MSFEPMPEKLLDFRVFLTMVWRHLGLPDPTPVQLDMAYWLQHGPRRSITEGFRGVGKSWITSTYTCHQLRIDPQLKFLVVSASKERADNFSTFTLRLIHEIPLLQCLIPRSNQRNSKVSFDVAPARPDHAPSVKSVGIFGQLTGSRADIIIPDDIEVPNNSFTQAMRDKLSEAVKEFDALLKPNGAIKYLGTPQTEGSLYNQLPERGYAVRIWPARYPTLGDGDLYGERLAPMIQADLLKHGDKIVGKTTDPLRFSDEDLLEREISYGRGGFNLQFMLDTRQSDANRYPLKLSDLLVMSLNAENGPEKLIWSAQPNLVVQDINCVGLNGDRYYAPVWVSSSWVPYTGSVMAIDPSGRGKDETAYAIVKMLNGYLYVLASGGFQDGYSDTTMNALANLAKDYGVNEVIVESNFGDGMFLQLLKPYLSRVHPCAVDEVRAKQQKEKRIIEAIEPVMMQHKLIVDRKVIEMDHRSTQHLPVEQALKYQLFYQMSRLTADKGSLAQDDRLDALAAAVTYWTEKMAQDVDKAVKSRRDELLRQELDVFQGHVGGELDLVFIHGVDNVKTGAQGNWINP